MEGAQRLATLSDAECLFELRRKSIVSLARKGMAGTQVEKWAANLTVAGMEQKLREMEIWVVELNGSVAAWGAIRGDRLEGLYTAPEFATRGIGSELLAMLEGLMHERGISFQWCGQTQARMPRSSTFAVAISQPAFDHRKVHCRSRSDFREARYDYTQATCCRYQDFRELFDPALSMGYASRNI